MVDVITDYVKRALSKLGEKLGQCVAFSTVVSKIEHATGIPASYITTSLTVTLILVFLLSYGPLYMCYAAITLYPAYKTFKCIEHREDPTLVAETLLWLKYWIIFSLFHAAEQITDNLLWWFPGYTAIKFAFLTWCFVPGPYNGSQIIYNLYVQPIFKQNSQTVDRVMVRAQGLLSKIRST